MGGAIGMRSTYTVEDVEAEIATLTPRLPVAELMNGGIIKLQGANGFFNPNSLLDPSWLRGKMTVDEYREAIEHINRCTAHSYIGLCKMFSTSERPMRENLRTQAGVAAVQQINERFRSVRFTYQPTAVNMQMDMSYSTDPVVQYVSRTSGSDQNHLIESITKQYALLYQTEKKPIKTFIQHWTKETVRKDFYAALYPPSSSSRWLERKKALIDQRIWLTSTEIALKWIGYIEGAIEAGERFAKHIIDSLEDR